MSARYASAASLSMLAQIEAPTTLTFEQSEIDLLLLALSLQRDRAQGAGIKKARDLSHKIRHASSTEAFRVTKLAIANAEPGSPLAEFRQDGHDDDPA